MEVQLSFLLISLGFDQDLSHLAFPQGDREDAADPTRRPARARPHRLGLHRLEHPGGLGVRRQLVPADSWV